MAEVFNYSCPYTSFLHTLLLLLSHPHSYTPALSPPILQGLILTSTVSILFLYALPILLKAPIQTVGFFIIFFCPWLFSLKCKNKKKTSDQAFSGYCLSHLHHSMIHFSFTIQMKPSTYTFISLPIHSVHSIGTSEITYFHCLVCSPS